MTNEKENPLKTIVPPTHPKLEEFSLEKKIYVAWREMDAFGHVNNIVYFRYLEDARLAYFWELGFQDPDYYRNVPNIFPGTKIGSILGSTSCEFKRPLSYPDILHVGARVSDMEGKRFFMDYRLVSREQEAVAAEGSATVVTYNYEKQVPVSIPDELRDRIENMEGRSFSKST